MPSADVEKTPNVDRELAATGYTIATVTAPATKTLRERIPAPSHIIADVTKRSDINFLLKLYKFYTKEKGSVLLSDSFWEMISERVHDALQSCASTCQKEIKKMQKMYLRSTQDIIINYALTLHNELPNGDKIQDKEDRIDASLLLQSIYGKCIKVLHERISYPLQGENRTIREQVNAKVVHTKNVPAGDLFPVAGEKKNVYYIIGFMRNQANSLDGSGSRMWH